MSAPLNGEGGSMKEVQNAALERDPDQDSLDSDSLGEGEDPPCASQTATCRVNAGPRAKCFINAADLMGDGDCEPVSARPDVLPLANNCPTAADSPTPPLSALPLPPPLSALPLPPPLSALPLPPPLSALPLPPPLSALPLPLPLSAVPLPPLPPPVEVARLQSEEKRKGSLLFNGSGCSSPEAARSPQRRVTDWPLCEPLPAELADQVLAGRLWGDWARPDLVSAGEDRGDSSAPPPLPQQQAESPSRRQPTSLDDVPIVAGHHEVVTPTPLPPRRPPDSQHVFFVDLNELPAVAEPAQKPRPRHGSDSVYLYIDLKAEDKAGDAPAPPPPRRLAAADAMSLSFHGATTTLPQPSANADEDSETGEAMSCSLFYTVGETGRPRRPPPELVARVPRQEKRRRNLSLDCHARSERERPVAAGPSPLLGSERTARPAGRSSLGATPEAARRASRTAEPRRQDGRPRATTAAGGRHSAAPGPGRREDSESGMERDSLESVCPPRRLATASAPPRRRSAQRAESSGRRTVPPVDSKPPVQRSFLRSHSGKNAVTRPDRVTAPPPPPRPPNSNSSGSGGTLTRRKAAGRPVKPPSAQPPQPPPQQQQQRRPAPRPPSPPASPPASDDASDVSSGKSFRRQSPETRNKQGIDELTADLLQMLSDGVHADVTIQVDNQEVSAHRCILAARSHYFRDLLQKPHLNVIHIDGHKLETVEFVLFHLYSGAMYVPEDVDLSDLITLAVMLGHKSLIRMAEFAMRVRLCHMFHKPCSECIPGVLETLCTAADCDLDDLAARCLAWVTQNRVAVWADPSFSEITDEYRAWCFQEAATLSQDTVLDVLLDCRRLSVQLPTARWSQQVRDMVETLLSNSVVFLSRNLGGILVSDKFMSLAESSSCSELEQYLLAAADVQNSADAHTSLEMISQLQSIPNHGWDKSFLGMLQRIKQVCNRRASGGQNYANLHMQRRTVRAQVPGRPAADPLSEPGPSRGRSSRLPSDSGADDSTPPRSRTGSRPGSNSSPESRSPYLRRKHLLGLDRDEAAAAAAGGAARRQNVRGGGGHAMTQSVVADPVSATETPGMNRSESFTIYKHE